VSTRIEGARKQSLCGTARKLNAKRLPAGKKSAGRSACRYAAIWTCHGVGDRSRRLAELPR
jgi:hypothetical protein